MSTQRSANSNRPKTRTHVQRGDESAGKHLRRLREMPMYGGPAQSPSPGQSQHEGKGRRDEISPHPDDQCFEGARRMEFLFQSRPQEKHLPAV